MRPRPRSVAGLLAALAWPGAACAQIIQQPAIVVSTPQPEPGSIVIRLGGRVDFFADALADSGDHVPGAKLANYTFGDYFRLYPSLDGVTAGGLKYGAFVELRSEQYQPAGGGAAGGGAGGGAGPGSATTLSIANANPARGSVFVRREYLYFGSDTAGTVRLGSTDAASGLLETGTFETFNEGGWNGDVYRQFTTGAAPTWPFAVNANIYTTTKVVYLSPQYRGFDAGLSFEPNTGSVSDYGGVCPYAGPGCDRLASSYNPLDLKRRRNTVDVALRYRGVIDGVGLATTVGYIGSSHVGAQAAPASTRYEGLSLADFGSAVTVGGLSFGGHVTYGRGNGTGYALEPAGASPEFVYLAGSSYTLGPLVVGGSFFQTNVAGASGPSAPPSVGQLRERGVAAGGTFTLAPGVSLFLDYLYGDRRENGVNLLGDGGLEPSSAHNATSAQQVGLGTQIRW